MKRPVNIPARFVYESVCCKAPATKPAVTMPKGKRIGDYLGAKPEGDATLGKWRCSQCHRKCKVTRSLRPIQEKFETKG